MLLLKCDWLVQFKNQIVISLEPERERGDNGLFITLVPEGYINVFLFIRLKIFEFLNFGSLIY